ncbi:MAG: hypothetical protein WCI20_00300 [bacterium]
MRNRNNSIRSVVIYICGRLLSFLALIAVSFGIMFFAGTMTLLIAMEMGFMIVLLAFIAVVLSDALGSEIDRRIAAAR